MPHGVAGCPGEPIDCGLIHVPRRGSKEVALSMLHLAVGCLCVITLTSNSRTIDAGLIHVPRRGTKEVALSMLHGVADCPSVITMSDISITIGW